MMSAQRTPSRLARVLGRLALLVLSFLVVLASLLGLSLLAYERHFAGRIYPGISVLGLPLGGLTPAQARELLGRELGADRLPYVALSTAEQQWTVSLQQLGGYLELPEVLRTASAMGRSSSFHQDLLTQALLLYEGYDFVPQFHLEPGGAFMGMLQIAREASHPSQRAQLEVVGLGARAANENVGRELDVAATRQAIEEEVRKALGHSGWAAGPHPALWPLGHSTASPRLPVEPIPVRLAFRDIVPPFTEVAGAKEQVDLILSSPLTLIFSFPEYAADGQLRPAIRRWSVDQAVLASWITLRAAGPAGATTMEVATDPARIEAFVRSISAQIQRPPREARFAYDARTQRLATLEPGQNGYALDADATKALLAAACASSTREITLPVRVVSPRVSRADLEALMPLQLISEGESSFRGSTEARLQNIRVAASRFHGLALPPRSTFSFLQHLGPVTVAQGYAESWIIYGDRTILGPGGGVCQVSTTCFRAAFMAGLPIVERWPHSYRVSWYEPPLGLDAAVFSPLVDMRFQNDTDTPMLLTTEVDERNAKLFFRLYGRPTGRQVTIEEPTTENPTQPGDPVLEEDHSLAAGVRVLAESPRSGLDVTLYRVIVEDGTTTRERFFSRYVPWPARYRVGPSRPLAGTPVATAPTTAATRSP